MGMILIAIKIVLSIGLAWFVCLCGIIGFETVRLGTAVTANGMFSVSQHYYSGALYMSFCLIGIVIIVKQAMTHGLFGISAYKYDEREIEKDKEEK